MYIQYIYISTSSANDRAQARPAKSLAPLPWTSFAYWARKATFLPSVDSGFGEVIAKIGFMGIQYDVMFI
jgi:hypothetical protein